MAVQNYLTLSHLRKAVASITQKINNLKPDWNAKAGEEGYIANRTHWVESKTITLIEEQTLNVEWLQSEGMYYANGIVTSELLENYSNIKKGNKIYICYQGNNYVREATYVSSDYTYITSDYIECTDYQFNIDFSSDSFNIDFYILDGRYENIPETITISATTVVDICHQLDNKYINGKFVQSGTGTNSEIFNDYENNVASGNYSHSEGGFTYARGEYSHAEGYHSFADGVYSHSEGCNNEAVGNYSHAEGNYTHAMGVTSHSEGYGTTASGSYSYAGGRNTTAQRRSQHVFGEYNILDTSGANETAKGTYIEIVGNGTGTSSSKRSNARTLDWSGNEVLKGKLTVGTAPTNNMDVATKQYVDTATASITDEKLSTGTIGNNVYYPIVGDNTASATTKYIDSTGLKYDATSSTNGYARLYLGNGTASGTEGSKYGRLMIYGTTAYAVTLDSGSPTENRSISLPDKNGTVALTSDVPSASSTTPSADGTGAVGTATTYARADHVHPKITQTISISSNVITLTGSDGTTSSVTLPVYNGGVSS